MKIRRTEIQIERERTLIISRRRSNFTERCEACAREVRMVTVDEAAQITRSTSRAIFRRVEAGTIHFTETPDGRLLICADSLS